MAPEMNQNGVSMNGMAKILGPKPRASVQLGGIVRSLDANGTFEPEAVIAGPAGAIASPHRSDVVTAEELVEMFWERAQVGIRAIVRDELERAVALDRKVPRG